MKKITLLVETIKGKKGKKSFENKKEMKFWLRENKTKIKKIALASDMKNEK